MTDAAPVPYQPVPEARLRVGDTERYAAATALGEHFATGRLDQAGYDARVRAASAGPPRADLQALFVDLPEPAPFRPAPPPAAPGWPAGRAARDRDSRRGWAPPVLPLLVVIAAFVAISWAVGFPAFPLLFLFWFGWGRRAWR